MDFSSLPFLFGMSIIPPVSEKVPSQGSVEYVCCIVTSTLIHKKISCWFWGKEKVTYSLATNHSRECGP